MIDEDESLLRIRRESDRNLKFTSFVRNCQV